MKIVALVIAMFWSTWSAHAELTSGEEIEDAELSDTVYNFPEEVTITPLYEYAGSGGSRPNCSCSGEASWYGPGFEGRKTANGEIFRSGKLTAAHRCLPLGTKIRVCLKRNGSKCVEVRVNDRGPYAGNRIIDLSKAAASQLGFIGQGHAQVTLSRCK